MSNDDNEEYLTPARVGECYAGLTVRWLARRRWAHLPPNYVKAGKRVLYRKADLESYLASVTRRFDVHV